MPDPGHVMALTERLDDANLAKRILKDGPKVGTDINGRDLRKAMTYALAGAIAALVTQSGVIGKPGRAFLVDVLRWHLGFEETAPITAKGLKPADLAFIRRRAWELLDTHRNLLPALTHDRPA